jgi:uncharacterized protein (TIGR02265 family)
MDPEPLYSENAVESLYRRALAGRITAPLQQELKQIGIDLGRPLDPAYPQAVWDRGLRCVATQLFAELPAPKAYFEVGRSFMAGFEHTLVGRAVVQFGKLIGPERTFHRMERNQRTTNNYSVLAVEKIGATHFRLHAGVEPAYLPKMQDVIGEQVGTVVSGVYFAVLELLALKEPRVTVRPVDLAKVQFDYDLTWTA